MSRKLQNPPFTTKGLDSYLEAERLVGHDAPQPLQRVSLLPSFSLAEYLRTSTLEPSSFDSSDRDLESSGV